MAGPFWGSLASGFFQGQDAALERDAARLRLKKMREEDEQDEKVRQNTGLGIEALAQLQAPPQQPPAQTPSPGQGSQPMQPPQQQMPRPPMQGQMPPPPGAQGAQQLPAMQSPFSPQMKPYTAPQAPPPPPPPQQQSLQPPPQQQQAPGQGISLQALMAKLHSQGMDGETAFRVAQRFEPILSQEGKMQLLMAQNEVRRLQADAAMQRADTGARGEDRRGATASGDNAMGASIVRKNETQSDANEARAALQRRKASLAGGKGSGEGGGYSDSDLTFLAQQALAGDTSVFQNAGRGAAGNRNVIAIRKKMIELATGQGNTGADAAATNAEYGGIRSGQRALGTAAANIGMAKSEATKMADLVTDASAKVPRSQFIPVNKALLAAEKGTGDPNVVQFGAAMNSFINAYARAVNPKGAPTVQDKNHAREMLETAQSHDQVVAVIAQLKKEMSAAQDAPGAVRSEMRSAVTGKKSDAKAAPQKGDIVKGYRFRGGDPSQQSNWEKVS